MSPRLRVALLMLTLLACGATPTAPAQQGEPPRFERVNRDQVDAGVWVMLVRDTASGACYFITEGIGIGYSSSYAVSSLRVPPEECAR